MDILDEYRAKLRNLCETNYEGKLFVPKGDLQDFWSYPTLPTFFKIIKSKFQIKCAPCSFHSGMWDNTTGCFELISILIWTSYPFWHHFHDLYCPIFREEPYGMAFYWAITLSPYDKIMTEHESFKRHDEAREEILRDYGSQLNEATSSREFGGKTRSLKEFAEAQNIFTPLRFDEDLLGIVGKKGQILPIIEDDKTIIGKGTAGTVSRVRIPRSCLKTAAVSQVDTIENYERYYQLACKRINMCQGDKLQMGIRELENLNLLKSRHLIHLNISQSIAALSIKEPPEMFILFNLALCDLGTLLDDQGSPYFLSFCKIPDLKYKLLEQMYWLSDALLFIHESLGRHVNATANNVAFCHLDIKPANILVYPASWLERQLPNVGVWKLTDFGIAGVSELTPMSKRNHLTWTLTDKIRRNCMFAAPELFHDMEIGRAADVWSLGCVMFLVTLLGYDDVALRELYSDDKGLIGRSTNDTSDAPNDRFYRQSIGQNKEVPYSGKVNPHVSAWLDRTEKDYVGKCDLPLFGLIRDMLCVDPGSRIKMIDVLARLQPILQEIEKEKFSTFHNLGGQEGGRYLASL